MDDLHTLLKEIVNNFNSSKEAYRAYLEGGKTFRFATDLKKYNGRIVELLTSGYPVFPGTLQQDADALLHHYHAWATKWEALAAAIDPGPDDVFVFENDITFPRPSAQRLEATYAAMKEGM